MKPSSIGSASQIPNNLPSRPSPFVNREAEIQQVINALLDREVFVVALVGVAGIGKSTLALEIAYRLLSMGRFTGGIFWLPARDLRSTDDLFGIVGDTLGVSSADARNQLNSERCLIILDGLDEIDTRNEPEVEHFLSLLSFQKSKVLVTSRKQPTPKKAATIQVGAFTEQAAKELLESLNASQVFENTYLQHRWGIDELIRILGYHPLALTLATKLLQGSYTEVRKNLQQLLAVSDSLENERERFTLLFNFALQSQEQGDYTEALQLYGRALETAKHLGDRAREASTLKAIGDLRGYLDEFDVALENYAHALALFRAVGDRLGEANTLKAIGDIQQFRKELDAALESYAHSLALFRVVGDRLGEANTLKAIGDIQQFRKELDAALESYAQALVLFRAIGARLGEANVLQAIGDVQQFRKELDAALESYAQALALFREIGARLGEANVLQSIGDVQQFRSETDAALENYAHALALFRAVGDRLGEANTLKAIGDIQQFRKELDAAFDSYAHALALFRAVGDRLGEANTLKAIGDIQQFRKELDAALESYAQALVLFRAIGARLGKANVLQAIGDVQQFRSETDAAVESYTQALALFRAVGDRLGEANTLKAIGDIRRSRREIDAALQIYKEAKEIFHWIGARLGLANVLQSTGEIYQLLSDRDPVFLEVALDTYNEALAVFRSIGSRLGEANVLFSIGQLLLEESHLQNLQVAHNLFETALAIYEQIGDRYSRARALYNLGLLYQKQGDLERAVQTLEQSRNAFVAIGLAEHPIVKTVEITFANVANELAKHYIEQGRWYDALHLLEENLTIYRQSDDLDGRADTIYQIARTHHLIGNLDKARTHYRDALRLYEHTQNQSGIATCKTGLGRLMIQMGFLEDAICELETAKQIYQQLGANQRMSEIEEVLQIANHIKEKQRI